MSRLTRTIGLLTLLGSLISLAGESGVMNGSRDGGKKDACKPTYLHIPEKTSIVQVGAWEFNLTFLVIGCEEQLTQLGDEELRKVLDILVNASREKHLGLLTVNNDRSFRSQVASRVNSRLRKNAVTDVFFNLRSASEKM